jgi:hypothetical protein
MPLTVTLNDQVGIEILAQFLKNVLLELKKVKLWNKHNFVENKTGHSVHNEAL